MRNWKNAISVHPPMVENYFCKMRDSMFRAFSQIYNLHTDLWKLVLCVKRFKNNLAILTNNMSSRSLAAARARRAGENTPPVSGNRPVTSIASQSAFVQQMPPGYQPNMPPPAPNVRVARGQPMPSNNAYQQVQQSQQQAKNSLPFSKLSISDAIGLITLRLGRVEQWVMETDHEHGDHNESSSEYNLPENSRIIDNSVLTSIINRLDLLEKNESEGPDTIHNEGIAESITKLTEQLTRIGDEGVKHNLAIAKHTEQLFKFERELVETKDILKTFMMKYDLFASETNNRFSDFEYAIADLEKNVQITFDSGDVSVKDAANEYASDFKNDSVSGEESLADADSVNDHENINTIMSVDLKNIIKQELASGVN